jgi:RNA polymerase sigma-70 factor (ECF subfamily)
MRVSFSADGQDEPEDVVHWLLLHLEVQQAMEKLPELQRQTLIMYSEENMSYDEIAVAMDTTMGTVKSRLYHARQTLRRLLKPETVSALQAAFADDPAEE